MSADLNFATCSEDVVDTRALSSAQGLPGAFVTSFVVDASRDDGEGNVDVGQQRINVPRRA